MAESADRWVRAERRADGVADKGLGKALKAYFTVYLPIGVVLLFAIGAGLAIVLFRDDWASPASYLSSGLGLAALGVLVGGLAYNWKVLGTAVDMSKIEVTGPLNDAEKKAVRREILGTVTTDPTHLRVKRAAAVQLRRALATQLLIAPVMVCVLLQQVSNPRNPFWWLAAAFGALYLFGMAFLARDFRRAGQFLGKTK